MGSGFPSPSNLVGQPLRMAARHDLRISRAKRCLEKAQGWALRNLDTLIPSEDAEAAGPSGSADKAAEQSDVWTHIQFTVDTKTDEASKQASAVSGPFNVEAKNWLASMKANNSFSKTSQYVLLPQRGSWWVFADNTSREIEQKMASCKVVGSL